MSNIKSLKRYIDDGSGFYSGTKRQYCRWIDKINQKINKYGLTIDEYTIADPHQFTSFLDIQFALKKTRNFQQICM